MNFTNEQIAQAVRDSLAAGYTMDQVYQGAMASFGVSPEQLNAAMGSSQRAAGSQQPSPLSRDEIIRRLAPNGLNAKFLEYSQGVDLPTGSSIPLGEIDGVFYEGNENLITGIRRTGKTGAVLYNYTPDGQVEVTDKPNYNKRNPVTDAAVLAALAVTGANVAGAGFLNGGIGDGGGGSWVLDEGVGNGIWEGAGNGSGAFTDALGPEYFMADGAFPTGVESLVNPTNLGTTGGTLASGAAEQVVVNGTKLANTINPALVAGTTIGGAALVNAIQRAEQLAYNGASNEQIANELKNAGVSETDANNIANSASTNATTGNTGTGTSGPGITPGQVATGLQLANAANQLANGGPQAGGGTIDPQVRQMFTDNVVRANQAADALRPRQIANLDPTQSRVLELMRDGAFNNAGLNAAQDALGRLGSFNAQEQQINPQTAQLGTLGPANMGQAFLGGPAAQMQAAQIPGAALANAGTLGNARTFDGADPGQAAMAQAAQVDRGGIRNAQAGNFLQANINDYLNPYTTAVIDRAAQDNERNRVLQQQQMNAQAIGRGAFGGSRQAVMEAENARNFADTQARTASNLRAQGFDTAANLIQSDLNRAYQASAQNQGMDANVAFQNAGYTQQTNLANQNAQNQFALTGAANRQQAGLSNQAAQNQFDLTRYGTNAATSQFNAGQINNINAQNAGFLQGANQFNAGAQNQMAQFNAGQQQNASQFGAQQQNTFDLNRFGAQNQINQFNAQQNNAAQAQNAANGLQAQGMNLNAAGSFLNGGLQFNNALFNNAGQVFNAYDTNRQLQQQQFDANRQNIIDQQQLRNSALGINGVVQSGMQAPQSNQFGQALGLGFLGLSAYNSGLFKGFGG